MHWPKISILTYHSLDESRSVISTSPVTFKKQMEFLWKNRYQALSLSEVLSFIRQKKPFPEKALVITFDDGYENIYTHAFPVLKQYGLKGTIFLTTSSSQELRKLSSCSSWFEHRPLLSWPEIKKMHEHGFEFGAHTRTHRDLTQIPIEEAELEIIQSKAEIQDQLGVEVKAFAYPYGKYDSIIKGIVEKEFDCACSTRLGKVQTHCDPYTLKRIDMYYLRSSKLFRTLSSSTMDFYLSMRQVFRDIRATT
jgi:peptidoglycan/xylan/chitin deacetylase (PgdA/CDA1 family)